LTLELLASFQAHAKRGLFNFTSNCASRGGKLKFVQFGFFNPFYFRAIKRLRFAGNDFADEKFQADGFFRVVVKNLFKQFADRNLHAGFLADFADEALFKSFVRLALAAGKFPKPAEVRFRVALGD
jgi:hypothetical protein